MKTIFTVLSASFLLLSAAQAATPACQGYFDEAHAYVITDNVPSTVQADDVNPVVDESGVPLSCEAAMMRVIRRGGLRIFGQNVPVTLKLALHPEEAELLIQEFSTIADPARVKLAFRSGLDVVDSDGMPAFFATVSKVAKRTSKQ